MPIERIGVVGCGLMGSGIAEVCARSGYPTVVREVDQELLDAGMDRIHASLRRAVDREKMAPDDMDEVLGRIHGTVELAGLGDCDLVIEAITEDLEIKRRTFAALDEVCAPQAIFASNTSSLSITEMAVATERPERFLGLHFFNPVPVMRLVEVVRTLMAADEVVERGVELVESLDKTAVVAKDRTGFIVNRLLVPYLLDAIRVLDEGLASARDIDAAMKLGCGHPMGPLTLLDFVGLDTTYYIANIMFDEFGDPRFAPPPLLKRMVLAGRHGRKSGRGFYEYDD